MRKEMITRFRLNDVSRRMLIVRDQVVRDGYRDNIS